MWCRSISISISICPIQPSVGMFKPGAGVALSGQRLVTTLPRV
jgi:hypothetical protein